MPTLGILSAGVFAVFALGLVLPALVAGLSENWRALEAILMVMTTFGFLALVTMWALNARKRALNRAGIFGAAITVWLSLVCAAMPVFMLVEGQGPVQAFFEATSAAVTLGATLRPGPDISITMAFYRAMVAWFGGLTTLTLAVYILGPYQVGGTPNSNLRLIHHARSEVDPRIFRTLRDIAIPYFGLTALCALLLMLVRVPPPDALIVAMSMLSTNGFVPNPTGASVLNNFSAELIMMVFMVLGATSIVWHKMLLERRWSLAREQSEGLLFLTLTLVVISLAILGSFLVPHQLHSNTQHVFNFAFDVVSTITTTGITHDQRIGVGLPFELVLLLVFVGGCSYSTAGGIKVFRLGTMLQHFGNELNRLVYPNAMLRDDVQYSERPREISKAVWSAFFLAILTLTIAILLFAAAGYDLPSAMALASGTFSQVGNLVSGTLPGLQHNAVPEPVLMLIAVLSLIARIEILVVLAAFAGKRW